MANYARIDEITNEIRKIRTEQECVEDYLKGVWKQEDENYSPLRPDQRRSGFCIGTRVAKVRIFI